MTVESKSVVAQCPQEKLYDFLSDFNNIAPLAPAGAIEFKYRNIPFEREKRFDI